MVSWLLTETLLVSAGRLEELKTMATYEVVVGNIGTVHSGGFIDTARAVFAVYVGKSKSGVGRASDESVYLMKDGEPIQEYIGVIDQKEEDEDEEADEERKTMETKAKTPSLLADSKLGNMWGWQERHNAAVSTPHDNEAPIVNMLMGWSAYAERHYRRFESTIGEDYVLGPHWESIGDGLRGLLNGETGRLDCGTLDSFILDTMVANGIAEAYNK